MQSKQEPIRAICTGRRAWQHARDFLRVFPASRAAPLAGGELRVCQTRLIDGIFTPADALVAPQGDNIVFFESHVAHEVLPVLAPSRAFADSRFTVNGWIHRMARPRTASSIIST